MLIREYDPSSDFRATAELFYETVHSSCAGDYTAAQLDAWAPGLPDPAEWAASFTGRRCFVAAEGGFIAGFGDIDASGYLDRLFVRGEYQRRGVATALCERLEGSVSVSRITVRSSVTAKPFFEARGYRVAEELMAVKRGVPLRCFNMEKILS